MNKGKYLSDHWNRAGSVSSVKPCDRDKVQLVDSVCTSEFIYYELFRYNNTFNSDALSGGLFGNQGSDVPATFLESRTQPILDKPSDYKFAVSNFSIPSDIIPMFRFNNTNPDSRYTVSMFVDFNNSDPNDLLYFSSYINIDVEYIYNINTFITALNSCILKVFNGLVALYNSKVVSPQLTWQEQSAYLPQSPVFLKYEASTGLINAYGPIQMSTNDPNGVGYFENFLVFSDNLANLFLGLYFANATFINDNAIYNRSNYKTLIFEQKPENSNVIVFSNPGASDTQYIVNEQLYSSIENWYHYKKLVITSNTLGVRKQAVGFQKDIYSSTQNSTQNGSVNNNVTKSIIADYDIVIDYTASSNPATRLVYSANQYRWIDIFDDRPLFQIDCQLYLINNINEFIPLNLTSGDAFSVKFVFAKSPTYN